MNTFGLKKKGQSPFWLKGGVKKILEYWDKVIRFKVYVSEKIRFKVEL